MLRKLPIFLAVTLSAAVWAQNQPASQHDQNVPLYRVTVVERTIKAINYQYRSGPTQIDFRGTVLMPEAKGEAVVESKRGRTEIDAKFDRVSAPTRFGRQYLTYVLWAITPDGHAKNLGEVVPGSSDKAHLRVTTDLQDFGLIVSAEPYSAVRQPGDVVVLENEIRPDTVGGIEPIQVKYELLPRGEYTYDIAAGNTAMAARGPSVPMDRYEALVAVYQAQNAIQIARAAGAADYAADVFQKAEQQYENARQLEAGKSAGNLVVTAARQAEESAEDARTLAVARKHNAELAKARSQAATEHQLRLQAEAAAQRAQAQNEADRMELESERAQVQSPPPPTPAPAATQPVVSQPVATPVPPPQAEPDAMAERQRTSRMHLFEQLRGSGLPVLDSPRGIVVTVGDGDFRGVEIAPSIMPELKLVAAIVAARPGLVVEVDGNSDSSGDEAARASLARAEEVRNALAANGMPVAAMTARDLGSSRLLGPNTSGAERVRNRRVEIVISGEAIGNIPYWDRPYSIR